LDFGSFLKVGRQDLTPRFAGNGYSIIKYSAVIRGFYAVVGKTRRNRD
jgi:hypothetical protein